MSENNEKKYSKQLDKSDLIRYMTQHEVKKADNLFTNNKDNSAKSKKDKK